MYDTILFLIQRISNVIYSADLYAYEWINIVIMGCIHYCLLQLIAKLSVPRTHSASGIYLGSPTVGIQTRHNLVQDTGILWLV
jgi:hypothetical protein